jgi:hypothetical protein
MEIEKTRETNVCTYPEFKETLVKDNIDAILRILKERLKKDAEKKEIRKEIKISFTILPCILTDVVQKTMEKMKSSDWAINISGSKWDWGNDHGDHATIEDEFFAITLK